MAAAANLATAAGETTANLQPFWLANTLRGKLIAFWQACIATFPEQDLNSHPVSNYLAILASIADQMPLTGVSFNQFEAAVAIVYRLCWMTNQLQVTNLITAAQGSTGPNSILVQYNANF